LAPLHVLREIALGAIMASEFSLPRARRFFGAMLLRNRYSGLLRVLFLIVAQDFTQFNAARLALSPSDDAFDVYAFAIFARLSTRAFGSASSSRDFNWNFQLFAGNLVSLERNLMEPLMADVDHTGRLLETWIRLVYLPPSLSRRPLISVLLRFPRGTQRESPNQLSVIATR